MDHEQSQTVNANQNQSKSQGTGVYPEAKVIPLPQGISDDTSKPWTFTNRIERILISKGKYRETLYFLIGELYAACRLGFTGITEAEREENMKVLACACVKAGVTGKDYYLMLGKLAFGDDSKQVSSIVHVIKVAEKNDVAPFNFVSWLIEKGGVQAIRSNYRSDGTLKPEKKVDDSKTSSAESSNASDSDVQTYITMGKTALNTRVVATIPKGQLSIIEKIGTEAECTAILRQAADGSFVVKAVLTNQNLVDSLYEAFGRSIR